MRKIATKKDREKKERRNQFIVGGILILIMFFSVLGYSLQSGDDEGNNAKSLSYNGYEFASQNGFWVLKLGDFQFVFQNNPEQTELNETVNISSDIKPLSSYSGQPLYVFSENDDAKWEIYRNLYPKYNSIVQRIQDACPENKTCTEDIPTKTCKDNFIIIRKSDENRITQDENCVFIEGKEENLMKLIDEYLFRLTGVK